MFGHRPPSVVAALAADALDVLATAIEEAATPDPLAVANQIRDEGIEVGGVLGTIEFDGSSTAPDSVGGLYASRAAATVGSFPARRSPRSPWLAFPR